MTAHAHTHTHTHTNTFIREYRMNSRNIFQLDYKAELCGLLF